MNAATAKQQLGALKLIYMYIGKILVYFFHRRRDTIFISSGTQYPAVWKKRPLSHFRANFVLIDVRHDFTKYACVCFFLDFYDEGAIQNFMMYRHHFYG